jgi:hypothetical protein
LWCLGIRVVRRVMWCRRVCRVWMWWRLVLLGLVVVMVRVLGRLCRLCLGRRCMWRLGVRVRVSRVGSMVVVRVVRALVMVVARFRVRVVVGLLMCGRAAWRAVRCRVLTRGWSWLAGAAGRVAFGWLVVSLAAAARLGVAAVTGAVRSARAVMPVVAVVREVRVLAVLEGSVTTTAAATIMRAPGVRVSWASAVMVAPGKG